MGERAFDPRVVPAHVVELVRRIQAAAPCHLGGGAALAGTHLFHRRSRDIDLFCHAREDVRILARALPVIAADLGTTLRIVRDSPTFVRASITVGDSPLEIDLVHEGLPDIEPPPPAVEGVVVESFVDLRAAKLTCLISRCEPRDLVDVLFLERAGYPAEADLASALKKDAGMDAGTLAWLLESFPTRPLPDMLVPLTEAELDAFRRALRDRMKGIAVPRL